MLRIGGPTVDTANLEIVTTATLKSYLGVTGTGDDTLMGIVLDSVHRIIYRMIGNRFLRDLTLEATPEDSHDYLLSGRGAQFLKLPQWPISSITSVRSGYVNGTDPDADWVTIYTYNSTDYYSNNESGRLVGVQVGWPKGYNNIRVVWKAGYDTIPEDLTAATLEFASVVFVRAKDKRWDQLSIGEQAAATTYTAKVMTPEARQVIQHYAPEGFGLG